MKKMAAGGYKGFDVKEKIAQLSKFLGENDYLVGNSITVVDIRLAYLYDIIGHAYASIKEPNPYAAHENLTELHKRVYSLNQIKPLVTSEKWRKAPYFVPECAPWIIIPE